MSEPQQRHETLAEKLHKRRERHLERSRAYRMVYTAVAFLVVIAGLALVPLPGPGWAIVFIGLGMLSLEFKWAENLLEKVLDRLELAQHAAANASPMQKALGIVATVLGIAASVAAAILWDIPLLPV